MKLTSIPEIVLLVAATIVLILSSDKYLASGIIMTSLVFYLALIRIGVGISNLISKTGDLSSLQSFLQQLTSGK